MNEPRPSSRTGRRRGRRPRSTRSLCRRRRARRRRRRNALRLNIAVIPYIGLLPAVTRNGRLQCAISYTKWRVWNRLALHEMGTKGCGHRRKQGEQEPGRPPKMVHTARLPNPSCTMDQTKLENQPEMVHPARMGLPSCSMNQKVSQSLPHVAAWCKFSAPPPNNAFRATPAPWRIHSAETGLLLSIRRPI